MPTLRGTLLLLGAPLLLALSARWPVLRQGVWFWLTAVALLWLLDWWLARRALPLTVRRAHEERLSLAADNQVTLHVRQGGNRPISLTLRDEPPDGWVAGLTVLRAIIPPAASDAPDWQGAYHVHPLRRGNYAFGPVTARWPGPLRLFLHQQTFPLSAPVRVYPNLREVWRYDFLLQRNRVQEPGLRRTRQIGSGTEYERLREYQPDDDFRRIDWKATARRRKPVTVQYQVERSQTIVPVIDIGRMMQSPVGALTRLDYVINAVLLLGYVATGTGDRVGLMTFADRVQGWLEPRAGRVQFQRMLEQLYAVEAQPVEADFRQGLAYLGRKQRKRALIVLFTDLSGGMGMEHLVAHAGLLARSSLLLVVTISDPAIVAAAQQVPADSADFYQRSAAATLLDERRLALDTLAQRGVLTLDVPATALSPAVIRRYLDIKRHSRL
jgi:uncharacterized protein (DUF58 family)